MCVLCDGVEGMVGECQAYEKDAGIVGEHDWAA
jgi:hypothetical protein